MNDHFRGVRNMINDTPRTDANNCHDGDYDDPLDAFADFSKQLELELNAAQQRIKRLEEAGDALYEGWIGYGFTKDKHLAAWRKAKEDKL